MLIRSDGEQRRAEILETACAVFGEKGYHKATFAEMGKRGNFNPALISFHFRSKDDLYCEVWHKLAEEVQACWPIDGGLGTDAPAEARLRAHIQASLGRHSDNRMRNFVLIHTQERVNATGLLEDELRKQDTINREHAHDMIADFLGDEADETDIHLCEMSVMNQLSILRPPKPNGPQPTDEKRRPAPFTTADIERLTDHITRFSLGGLEAIRQDIAKRKTL
jgi:AcrR family transcriptional regulator